LKVVNNIVTKRVQIVKNQLNAIVYFNNKLTFRLIGGNIIMMLKLIDLRNNWI